MKPSKRCVLLVVDALSYDVVKDAIDRGRLSNLSRLASEKGRIDPCYSIFPSITPAATCSIATGEYPAVHGVEGAFWLDRELDEPAYYGDDIQLALKRGFQKYLADFGDRLNFERLTSPTLFQLLHDRSIESACINFMWFAGPHLHERETPALLRATAGALPPQVRGPKFLKLGDFVESLPPGVEEGSNCGIFSRYGFSDEVTVNCMMRMAQADQLPPMTVAYFPENDDDGHLVGQEEAANTILFRFDHFLGEFVEALGGWQRIGNEIEIMVVGDHSQVEFGEQGALPMRIDECLKSFRVAPIGGSWKDGDELYLCPNMRAAAIYARNPEDASLRRQVVELLLADEKVDQVIYTLDEQTRCVETADRGELRFRAEASGVEPHQHDGAQRCTDTFGNRWEFRGSLATIDARLDERGVLEEGDYPNPLERLDGAFVPGSRPIWVTARPDAEFRTSKVRNHDGGSHGSLHQCDSVSALLTSGGVPRDQLPCQERTRIVDVVQLCLGVLASEASTAVADEMDNAASAGADK